MDAGRTLGLIFTRRIAEKSKKIDAAAKQM